MTDDKLRIIGFRDDVSDSEKKLVNEFKVLEFELAGLVDRARELAVNSQDHENINEAQRQFKVGFMLASRSIFKPVEPWKF
jgi:hypothetical protein